jgi:hypothetical protein
VFRKAVVVSSGEQFFSQFHCLFELKRRYSGCSAFVGLSQNAIRNFKIKFGADDVRIG